MFKGKKQLTSFIYLGVSLIVVLGFTAGYIFTISDIKNDNTISDIQSYEATREKENVDNDESESVLSQNIVENGTLLTKNFYSVCGHIIKNKTSIPQDIRDLDESKFKLAYSDWKVEKFSQEEIVISKIINEKCPNHYILKEKDGKVAVFYQQPIDGAFLRELTNISTINLTREDQQKLDRGIIVNSNEELAEILEDLSS